MVRVYMLLTWFVSKRRTIDGSREWSILIGSTDEGYDVCLSPDGNSVYVTGRGVTGFDGQTTTYTGAASFLSKRKASDGSMIWVHFDIWRLFFNCTNLQLYSGCQCCWRFCVCGWRHFSSTWITKLCCQGQHPDAFLSKRSASDGSKVWTIFFGINLYR